MKTLSIIVPCYYEEESIPLFYKAIEKLINNLKISSLNIGSSMTGRLTGPWQKCAN
jgi:hypothetical protein